MTDEQVSPDDLEAQDRWDTHDDGRSTLAIAAGIGAAVAGGLIWAAIAIFGNLEIGWAAWGVGALVGAAMARVTVNRSRGLGTTAAMLAAGGLLLGKLFIFYGSVGPMAEELAGNQEYLEGALAWEMYAARELDAVTLDSVDAIAESGDTLSDALWATMKSQAATRLSAMSPEERSAAAASTAKASFARVGMLGGITSQLGLFDLLWFGLAIATAFGFLSKPTVTG
jgi:hypothetical protein